MCSPRAWGWSEQPSWTHSGALVFPTGVGMVRPSTGRCTPVPRVPHGRGDGPSPPCSSSTKRLCSPRAWGWSALFVRSPRRGPVFPTGVGMVRGGSSPPRGACRVPHGRGDGPSRLAQMNRRRRVPHGRGDGPFQQRLEALAGRVPHGRGDGPQEAGRGFAHLECSPRAWGWSVRLGWSWPGERVFPTGVGMVRTGAQARRDAAGVPHGRGDGPGRWLWHRFGAPCSPRAWGWSVLRHLVGVHADVFPTGVGMVRPSAGHAP